MLSVLATTLMPWPPSVEAGTFSAGLTKKPVTSPTTSSLAMPGMKANQFIIIATWPDLKASSPCSM